MISKGLGEQVIGYSIPVEKIIIYGDILEIWKTFYYLRYKI